MTTSPSVVRVAVVTGGARGIGLASAEWFLRNGYRVALLDNDSATLAQTDATLNQPDRVLACLVMYRNRRRFKRRFKPSWPALAVSMPW